MNHSKMDVRNRCAACGGPLAGAAAAGCGHVFCGPCVSEAPRACPVCGEAVGAAIPLYGVRLEALCRAPAQGALLDARRRLLGEARRSWAARAAELERVVGQYARARGALLEALSREREALERCEGLYRAARGRALAR